MKPLSQLEPKDIFPVLFIHVVCWASAAALCACPIFAVWFYNEPGSGPEGPLACAFGGVLLGLFYGALFGIVAGIFSYSISLAFILVRDWATQPKTRSELYLRFDNPLREASASLALARQHVKAIDDVNAIKEINKVEEQLSTIRKILQ